MNGSHLQIFLTLAVVLASAGLLLWSAVTIRYHITTGHLKITWLGVPVRRFRLDDIKRIGTRPVIWAERWPSTLRQNGRLIVIRRRSGWLRSVVITPKYPFEFRNELEQAIRSRGLAPAVSPLHSTRDPAERRAA
jgi:hypothetical protein